MKYSVIIPAYREEAIIGSSLVRLAAYLEDQHMLKDTEVIVVAADGGDKTAEIARDKARYFATLRLVEPGPKVGKGRDVHEGVKVSTGEFILFTDADLATPEYYIGPAFQKLSEDVDVVIGVRELRAIHKGLKRTAVSLLTNILTRIVLLPNIPDTQCGFKGFTRDAALTIFKRQTINGWGFDMEIIKIAKLHKLKIFKMRIPDWHDPKIDQGLVGESSRSAAWNTFKELLTIRMNSWKGRYE